MTGVLLGAALFLLLTLGVGALRVALGPHEADRMLAAQLFGTTGVAVLLLLSQATATPSMVDVALVFALLAVIAAVTFVRRTRPSDRSTGGDDA